jgi:hypothetical protein
MRLEVVRVLRLGMKPVVIGLRRTLALTGMKREVATTGLRCRSGMTWVKKKLIVSRLRRLIVAELRS